VALLSKCFLDSRRTYILEEDDYSYDKVHGIDFFGEHETIGDELDLL